MVIRKDEMNYILWISMDDSLKQLDEFKDLEDVIVIANVVIPEMPEDYYMYTYKYNEISQEIELARIGDRLTASERKIHSIEVTTKRLSDDTLLGIELQTDTNEVVNTTSSDSLLVMELMMTIDAKLTQLLQSKQA